MKIIAIVGLMLVGWMFIGEIKAHKWRGVLLCGVVSGGGLLVAFKKELGLDGVWLYLVSIGLATIPLIVFSLYPETGNRKSGKKK